MQINHKYKHICKTYNRYNMLYSNNNNYNIIAIVLYILYDLQSGYYSIIYKINTVQNTNTQLSHIPYSKHKYKSNK